MADELKEKGAAGTTGEKEAAETANAASAKEANVTGTKASESSADAKGVPAAGAAKPAAKRKPAARPVPKSALTRHYDAVKERVWAGAAKVRAAFFGDSWAGGAMWFAAVLAMIAVLLWFFFFSDFGTPAEPIYEGF